MEIKQEIKPSILDKGRPSNRKLLSDIKKHKRYYYYSLPIVFIFISFIMISIPNSYTCTVKLAPELSGSKSSSSLSSIASSFGIKLGAGNDGSEALFPILYPDLMNSVAFKTSLFPVLVKQQDCDSAMTYYDYLLNAQKRPWWSVALKSVLSLFSSDEKSPGVNPFQLTEEQYNIVEEMDEKVICDVDKKYMVITINVTDHDPLIAATMADSVQIYLQKFITDYRTKKARVDLEHNKKLFKEAQNRYEEARQKSASYNDANQKAFLDRVRSEQTKLDNEMQIQYQAYSQIATQLRMSEARVQEETPAFTMLQPATVPIKKSAPRRTVICLLALVVAFIFTTLYCFHKEGDLLPFFGIHPENN